MKICVIIPTLNEAAALPDTLVSIGSADDVIIVDGGSNDATCDIAQAAGARVIRSAPPRAHQLNLAARQSDADILLFLHADTRLPEQWRAEVIAQLQKYDIALGAFSLRIAGSSAAEAFIAAAANWRSRLRQLPYGDRGCFCIDTPLNVSVVFQLCQSWMIISLSKLPEKLAGLRSVDYVSPPPTGAGVVWAFGAPPGAINW